MSIIARQNLPQKLPLLFSLCLDHILPVMAVEKKLPRLTITDELDVVKVTAQGKHVVRVANSEVLPDFPKAGGRVVLEFEGMSKAVGRGDIRWVVCRGEERRLVGGL